MSKAVKRICIIRKLDKALPQHSLITIYKSFVRPHLDCDDIIYDQPNQESLNQKLERIQYNAALAITGASKGTYQSRLVHEQKIGLNWVKQLQDVLIQLQGEHSLRHLQKQTLISKKEQDLNLTRQKSKI